MVFESLVTDLVNKYLGDYIENLDRSQLKIGIWGGDVVLRELDIKENALDDLDLPIRVLHGHLGTLTLKIPWKNLYTEPVIATLDGLYLLAVPNQGIKYNAEKEDKQSQEAKQKELQRIEEAKRAEAEKNKKTEKKPDSFAEKLATQVIKNLQVEVSDIHVRYEDVHTNPSKPFSVGVTLKNLSFQTTDESWHPCIIKEAVTKIYKMIKLDCLALYWNCNSPMYNGFGKGELTGALKRNIISPGHNTDYKYMIEPISSTAQLRIHTKPEESDYSIPKLFLNILFQEIAVGLTRNQYLDVMELLDGMERMSIGSMYRKYRPGVPLSGNSKEWWHYGYKCILEETVRRRRKMWSWTNIKNHRDTLRTYRELWKKKVNGKKFSSEEQKSVDLCEKSLDVFNITLARQQAEVEAKKKGQKEEEKGGGWFGGWWGGKKAETKKSKDKDIESQFYELMTPEEKAKLYGAIGYQENAGDLTLPKEFVANKLHFKLNNLSLALKDEEKSHPQVVKIHFQDVFAAVGQRPSANAVRVEAKMDTFNVLGSQQNDGSYPKMVASQNVEANRNFSLLDVQFETNPLDGECDQKVNVRARPLEIIYDACTINQVAEFFKPPESVQLKQLQAAAFAKLDDLKEQTATGLQFAIQQHKFTDIFVDLKPSYVIIPHGGTYHEDVPMLVLDLGSLRMSSERDKSKPKLEKMDSVEEIMKRAYDKFNIKLQSLQLLYASPGEDWREARRQSNTEMHILKPMGLNVTLHKAMFIKDSRMPKMRVNGELPLLSVNMSDKRLHDLIDLAQSIPLPKAPPAPPEDPLAGPDLMPTLATPNAAAVLKKIPVSVSSDSLSSDEEFQDAADQLSVASSKKSVTPKSPSTEFANMTDLELTFILKEVNISLFKRVDGQDVPTLKLVIDSLGTEVKVRTFDLMVEVYLGGIYVQHLQFRALNKGPLINLINTPVTEETAFRLLRIQFLQAKKKGPEFATTYENTLQKLTIEFSVLEILLHQDAVLNVMEFAQALIPTDAKPPAVASAAGQSAGRPLEGSASAERDIGEKAPSKRKIKDPDIIDLKVVAKLDTFSLAMCTDQTILTDIKIKGLEANVSMSKPKTSVSTMMKDIIIVDPTPNAVYPHILSIVDGEVFSLSVTAYNGATEGQNYSNMSCVDTEIALNLGRVKVVFLMKFVNQLLQFFDKFQAMTEKLSDASAAATKSAMMAAQNMNQKAARVSLNIHMAAPLIVVPQNSQSLNAVVADLGTLSLMNSFHLAGKEDQSGLPAVLDKMRIELTKLKLSRAVIEKGMPAKEAQLIEPMTLTLNIIRNLACTWYMEMPEVEITGKLPSIVAGMSQGDFTMIMVLLTENFSEGQPAVTATASSTSAVSQNAASSNPNQASGSTTTQIKTVAETSQLGPKSVEKMRFSFQLDSICAVIYTGDSVLSPVAEKRDPKASLGRFELKLIKVKGSMKSDNSLTANVILHNTILDDTRPGRDTAITRMVERTVEEAGMSEQQNMIDLTFTQQPSGDKHVDIKVNRLYICVCLEYLMAVGDFFVKGLPAAPPTPTLTQEDGTKVVVPSGPPPPSSEMAITIQVVKPEILMVEDSMTKDTQALLLDMEVVFKLRITPETQSMVGNIKALQIHTCHFDRAKRAGNTKLILVPCDISLLSNAPYGKGHHMDLCVSDVILNISPATLKTITAISSNLSPQPPCAHNKTEEERNRKEAIPRDLWNIKKYTESALWYLKSVTGVDALEEAAPPSLDSPDEPPATRNEQLMMSVASLVVTLEVGHGRRTSPMLILEAGFHGEVKDWSSRLYVSCDLSTEVAYYNEKLAVWEPLIEPVEDEQKTAHRPWELTLEMKQNDDLPPYSEDEESDAIIMPLPKTSISVTSYDMLHVTVTKTCLDLLTKLGKAFGDAYYLVEPTEEAETVKAPYILHNDTGMALTIRLDKKLELPPQASGGNLALDAGDIVPLYPNKNLSTKKTLGSQIKSTQQGEEKRLLMIIEEFGAHRELIIKRAEKRLFNINQRSYPGDYWAIVCQTDASYGTKTVTLRSRVQVKNHMPVVMEVYYKLDNGAFAKCGEVEPEKTTNLPLHAVYMPPHQLHFKPQDKRYDVSANFINWKDMQHEGVDVLSCDALAQGNSAFYMNVFSETESVCLEESQEKKADSYLLHLHPTMTLRNLLPYPIRYTLQGSEREVVINEGEKAPFLNACIGQTVIEVRMLRYLNREWRATKILDEHHPEELSVWTFETHEGSHKNSMDLGLHSVTNRGYLDMSLYAPYWMINKTGHPLAYKRHKDDEASDDAVINHAADYTGSVLFSFKSKSFFAKKKDDPRDLDKINAKTGTLPKRPSFRKKKHKPGKGPWKKAGKASLKVGDSEWSDKFSLDTVGSSGTVACKFNRYLYEIGVKISLSSSGLTKIVVFTPYYMLANHAKFTVTCCELVVGAQWCDVPPGECVPFWPVYHAKKMQMRAKVKDRDLETKSFPFNEVHTTLMKLDQTFGGINVECQVTESAVVVTFQQYQTGMAPVMMVNHTQEHVVEYYQSGTKEEVLCVKSGEMALYTWQDTLGKRELVWTCGEKKYQKDDLIKDGIGEFFADADTKVYWVSFLDGMQRVMLFTEDLAIATMAQQAGELERVEQEISLSLHGLGLSLVNNTNRLEVAYLGVTSSGVIWEENRKRFKALKTKQSNALESAWQRFQNEVQIGNNPNPRVALEGKMEVDFQEMLMFKPHKRAIRRSFENGIWMKYSTSPHQLQFHAKIHRLQLDNQLPGCVFQTVLAPIPPPKSVVAESVPKPFTEMSIMLRKHEHSGVLQFKYFKVLIQEMALKVDQGFLNALLHLFAADMVPEDQKRELFKEDLKQVELSLMETEAGQTAIVGGQKNFYDIMHFSPIKVHISFSLHGSSGEDGKKGAPVGSNVINLFLQSVGIVLTDVQDVVFKLGYFERNYSFYNQQQLSTELVHHYSGQAIKQMYVLVLGLDVLGNPFGLVRGIAEGIEDLFYEPYQGAIQGPEEFAEGLAFGVRSLFGHAVGGAAGAVSRITGTLGKGIAALTMDDEYQKKRREQLNKRPANVREGFARGGKGLVMGVFDGVTGIVRKPMEGAKAEGVKGFFTGMGKGLVGVVTRPASGMVDFASSSLEGIKRITDVTEETRRLRPPRFLAPDGVVRPYIHREAEGNGVLQDMEKGKYAATDIYYAHVPVTKDYKNILLVTDRRIIFVSKGELFGHWDCDWQYTWPELRQTPAMTPKGIQILLKEKQKKTIFSRDTAGKLIPMADTKLAEWVVEKMQEAMDKVKMN